MLTEAELAELSRATKIFHKLLMEEMMPHKKGTPGYKARKGHPRKK